jgi:hypothetical protein
VVKNRGASSVDGNFTSAIYGGAGCAVTRALIKPKTGANPEGKGANGFLLDWYATTPRGVVAKPDRQVLAELFSSMLVLSASFKYRPARGCPNYLYWIKGEWSLSLIEPGQWSAERRAGFIGICMLQPDMTWTISPSSQLADSAQLQGALRQFYRGFADMLNTDHALEELLPFYVAGLSYYPRLLANALSRSVSATVVRTERTALGGREWCRYLPRHGQALLAYGS